MRESSTNVGPGEFLEDSSGASLNELGFRDDAHYKRDPRKKQCLGGTSWKLKTTAWAQGKPVSQRKASWRKSSLLLGKGQPFFYSGLQLTGCEAHTYTGESNRYFSYPFKCGIPFKVSSQTHPGYCLTNIWALANQPGWPSEGTWAMVGARGLWGHSVPFAQFWHELKNAPKNKIH